MNHNFTRRHFLGTTAIAGAGLTFSWSKAFAANTSATAKPAILGGPKAHAPSFPGWPVFDQTEEDELLGVLRSGRWFRGSGQKVAQFEKAYESLTGAKHCVATSAGTTALLSVLGALGIGPGDEVILPPYTFVATYNVIVNNYALPVFVDTDPDSFEIDAKKVEPAITKQTRAIMPVHVGGSVADLDTLLGAAKKRNLPVIEDACQAHLAEWRGRVVGNWGLAGCFSFQASKNLNSGEGGAVITNDDEFAEKVYTFHAQGRGRAVSSYNFSYSGDRGANFRMAEFQAGLLMAQMTRLARQAATRDENAAYLTKLLCDIPGIKPARLHDGCTRSAHHLYMFRYQKEQFANLDRARFIEAMGEEGIPCSSGYTPLNSDKYVKALASNPHYQRIYGKKKMAAWIDRNRCPVNDKLCEEAIWFVQTMLLASKTEMDQIAEAILKIQKHAAEIAKL